MSIYQFIGGSLSAHSRIKERKHLKIGEENIQLALLADNMHVLETPKIMQMREFISKVDV